MARPTRSVTAPPTLSVTAPPTAPLAGIPTLPVAGAPTPPVTAPPGPVAWSPGMPPLSESLRARIRAGAGARPVGALAILPGSRRRVVRVPVVGSAVRHVAAAVGASVLGRWMSAPWGDVEPVGGVSVETSPVPTTWLRPAAASRPVEDAPRPPLSPSMPVHPPTGQRAPVPVPTSTRIRRAAMMAFGVLVSLVAVEAAARVGRR